MSNTIKIKDTMYITTDVFNDYLNSITEYSTHFYLLFGFGVGDDTSYEGIIVYKSNMTEIEIQEFRDYYIANEIYYIDKKEE